MIQSLWISKSLIHFQSDNRLNSQILINLLSLIRPPNPQCEIEVAVPAPEEKPTSETKRDVTDDEKASNAKKEIPTTGH